MPYINTRIHICFFLLTLFNSVWVHHAYAQEPVYTQYTVDEGLPSNEVYAVYEDDEGYIWFATDHGISRYDGYSFTNYSTSDGLVHNTVFGFYKSGKRVWMRTFNSSLCYMENGKFYNYRHNTKLRTYLNGGFIQDFAFDRQGNLWFITVHSFTGLHFQDAITGNISQVEIPTGYNAFIKELNSGEIIAGTDITHSSSSFTPSELTYKDSMWLFNVPYDSVASRLLARCKKHGNGYIFSFDKHIVQISNKSIVKRVTGNNVLHQFYIEKNGKAWLCATGFTPFDQPTTTFLNGYQGSGMLRDRIGNYWFTTLDNGVYMAKNLDVVSLPALHGKNMGELIMLSSFENTLFAANNKGNMYSFTVSENGIDTASSDIWQQTYDGLHAFLCVPEKRKLFLPNVVYHLPQQHPYALKKVTMTLVGIRAFSYENDSLFLAGNSGFRICDSQGNPIYISSHDGFSAFCTAIARVKNKKIWIGTTDGLFVFDGKKTIPYPSGNTLFRERITDIKNGIHHETYIATRGKGIIICYGNKIYNLRAKNGLSSDLCGTMLVDGNILWVCSNNGLNRITITRKGHQLFFQIEVLTRQHGLPSQMVNSVTRVGRYLFMATSKGLAWTNTDKLVLNKITPPVYIRSFLTNNHPHTIPVTNLKSSDRNISIEFIAIQYRTRGNISYRYRLLGYENTWNYTNARVARYFNLPPGEYMFAVSAKNENGIWNKTPTTIHFYLPAHFTQTNWFKLLLAIGIAVLSAGIVFLLVRQQRNKARTRLALAQAELKALRAQMKPHFIFNSLNSIQHFILERDEESAHLYLGRFSSLMRKILDNTRTNSISLTREIETLTLYLDLEKLRFGENFTYTIDVAPEVSPDAIELPPMLIQPYAENAIWHGLLMQRNRPPQLTIRFSISAHSLVCLIEDNGIGRTKSRELRKDNIRHSTGMKNIEERIAMLNKITGTNITLLVTDLYTGLGDSLGTRIVLTIPLHSYK